MTVERRPRQFLAVWSDDGKSVKGSTFEESFFVDGAFWKNEQSKVPLDGFEAFGEMFSSGLQAQHDKLVDDNAKLASEFESKATECDTANAALEKLAADMAKLVEAHKTAITEKEAELATANATIAALEARIASLLTELPFNPRIIDAAAFYQRITKDEFAALSVSDDETLRTIAKTILAYKTNDWPIVFESTEFQQMMGYLMFGTSPPFLSDERARELAKDATRDEAYDAS